MTPSETSVIPTKRRLRLSDWHRVKREHHRGKLVDAVICRQVGFGAICFVGKERIPAILRKREISWDPRKQDLTSFPEGTPFRAAVIDYEDEWRELIISIKAAEPTPFEKFVNNHRIGEIVECTIERLAPTLIVVRIEGGVEGEIPWGSVARPEFNHFELIESVRLAVGDRLKAAISRIDQLRAVIHLDLRLAIDRHDAICRKVIESGHDHFVTQGDVPPARYQLESLTQNKKKSVLIVDNDKDITQPFAALLANRSYKVHEFNTIATAKGCLPNLQELDFAVIDLQVDGVSGVTLFNELRERFPGCVLIALSGSASGLEAIDDKGVVKLLKPIDTFTLLAMIDGREDPERHAYVPLLDEAIVNLPRISHERLEVLNDATRSMVDGHLASIREAFSDTETPIVAILSLNESTREIRCVRSLGIAAGRFDSAASKLEMSFIGDVLRDHESGFYDLSRDKLGVIRAIPAANDFHAMYGLPLDIETVGVRLGVFAFWTEVPTILTTSDIQHVYLQATAMGTAISAAIFEAELVRQQRAIAAAALMMGMTHDLRNSVQILMNTQLELHELRGGPKSSEYQTCVARFDRQLNYLNDSFKSLLDMTKRTKSGSMPLDTFLYAVREQCQVTAAQDDVHLVFTDESRGRLNDLPIPMGFFQVMVNLILNAIQHTRIFRGKNRLVHVRVGIKDGNLPVIRVTDNAYGINWANRERLFDIYYTTRRDGSGIGLFVSRRIAESLGGKLYCESSYKYIGSTMTMRLPGVIEND